MDQKLKLIEIKHQIRYGAVIKLSKRKNKILKVRNMIHMERKEERVVHQEVHLDLIQVIMMIKRKKVKIKTQIRKKKFKWMIY